MTRPEPPPVQSRAIAADRFERQLRRRALPYWRRTCDWKWGGYRLADRQRSLFERLRHAFRDRPPRAPEKFVVSQARVLYVFSLAHRLGYSDPAHDYLEPAGLGYRFVLDGLFDQTHHAFNWKVNLQGQVVDGRKFLYGQAMGVYALVEYYRASGQSQPLDLALQIFRAVDANLRDAEHGGWFEQASESLEPIWPAAPGLDRDAPGITGLKGADAHLHWLEALSELYDATREGDVRGRLEEALSICSRFFYPRDPAAGLQYCTADWQRVPALPLDISYGHALEAGWLMRRAEQALQAPLQWDRLASIVDYCLRFGFDHRRGGFFNSGPADRPATNTTKTWWVQAEGLAALTELLRHRPAPAYERALGLLLGWIENHQILPDGTWISSTNAAGKWQNRTKAGPWKAGYHEVRATVKFVEAFADNAG